MTPELKQFYERELQFLYGAGAEFAQANRRIAARLALETSPCPDPYVERLLEGIAFLTARVQMKLDARHPELTQHLLELLYPQFLAPIPSCGIAELAPELTEGSLEAGVLIPRGSRLKTLLGKGEQTACEFQTARDVTLWPLQVIDARYVTGAGALSALGLAVDDRVKGAIRLVLRTSGAAPLGELPISSLSFYLHGAAGLAGHLYEQIIADGVGFRVRGGGSNAAGVFRAAASIVAGGVGDEEALLPRGRRGFEGYRHLQEYFVHPESLLFFTLENLRGAFDGIAGKDAELFILVDRVQPRLEKALEAAQFRLYCSPIVNLFPRALDRAQVSPYDTELHLVPDRNRPMDFEIHSVEHVSGIGAGGERLTDVLPLYSVTHRARSDATRAFYTLQRRPRLISTRQQQTGERTSYLGSEVFLTLSDSAGRHLSGELRQLDVEAWCTNRDLPLQARFGLGKSDFVLDSGAPVAAIRCIRGPTAPRAAPGFGNTAWSLINHFSLNTLSLEEGDAGEGAALLRKMLSLYADPNDPAAERQIEGIRGIAYQPIVRRIPGPGPITYGRGLGITLTVDDAAFEDTGPLLLGTVLDRFFALYVSLNSFTQLTVRSQVRGELRTWPVRLGDPGELMSALEHLAREPGRFSLFAALRLIEQAYASSARLGESGRVGDDVVRIAQPPHLNFVATDLTEFDPHATPAPRLEQHGFGLLGPNGPLPTHLTEFCFDRLRQAEDPGPSEFLNFLQHRIATLFYRAWANADPITQRDRPADDQFALDFGALVGLGERETRGRDALDDLAKLGGASHRVAQPRSAEDLRALLAEYFGLPLAIRPFIGAWLDIPASSVTRLGGAADGATLGAGATLGGRSWQRQSRFEIVLGPLRLTEFENFLPGAPGLTDLAAWVRLYSNDQWAWQVRLVLRSPAAEGAEAPASDLELGARGRLGWTGWLGRRPEIARDVVIDGDLLRPRRQARAAQSTHRRQ